jgi:hypothetical protein
MLNFVQSARDTSVSVRKLPWCGTLPPRNAVVTTALALFHLLRLVDTQQPQSTRHGCRSVEKEEQDI